jgi:hypothetical protein
VALQIILSCYFYKGRNGGWGMTDALLKVDCEVAVRIRV